MITVLVVNLQVGVMGLFPELILDNRNLHKRM